MQMTRMKRIGMTLILILSIRSIRVICVLFRHSPRSAATCTRPISPAGILIPFLYSR